MIPLRSAQAAMWALAAALLGGCDRDGASTSKPASSDQAAAPPKASSAPVDPDRMKKLLASPTSDQRAEIVKIGAPAVPYVKRRIQDFILASYKAAKDKQWSQVVNALQLVEVMGQIGKPAVPALQELCGDLVTMRKLSKDHENMLTTMKRKICPIVESHGEACRCKG